MTFLKHCSLALLFGSLLIVTTANADEPQPADRQVSNSSENTPPQVLQKTLQAYLDDNYETYLDALTEYEQARQAHFIPKVIDGYYNAADLAVIAECHLLKMTMSSLIQKHDSQPIHPFSQSSEEAARNKEHRVLTNRQLMLEFLKEINLSPLVIDGEPDAPSGLIRHYIREKVKTYQEIPRTFLIRGDQAVAFPQKASRQSVPGLPMSSQPMEDQFIMFTKIDGTWKISKLPLWSAN